MHSYHLVNIAIKWEDSRDPQLYRVYVPSLGHFFLSRSPVQTHVFAIFKN